MVAVNLLEALPIGKILICFLFFLSLCLPLLNCASNQKHQIISNYAYHNGRYDLVDLTRQVLSKLANQAYIDAVIAFRHKDVNGYSLHSQKFIQLVRDIDELLASDDNFLLGTWLENSKKLAVNHRERRQVSSKDSFFGLLF